MGSAASRDCSRSPSPLGVNRAPDLPGAPAYRLGRALPSARSAYPPASPLRSNRCGRGRNFNRLSIAYALRPRLRPRLTLSGRAFLRKPWAYGGQDSHLPYRYSYRHSHFPQVHHPLRHGFDPTGTLPYHPDCSGSAASVSGFSPGHFRRRATRPVSCYALFECMAASKPTSWLSGQPHILFHLARIWGP